MMRYLVAGIALTFVIASPSAALAAGKPTPTPTAVPNTATPVPATATPVPAPPTATSTVEVVAPEVSTPVAEPTPAPVTETTPTAEPAATVPAVAVIEPTPTPTQISIADDAFSVWHGMVREGGAYRRSAPSAGADILEELDPGTPIRVDAWVPGSMLYPDVITWGQVDPADGGGYIFGGSLEGVLPPAAPPPPEGMQDVANWIDVNLTLNVVTAYEDGAPVKSMLASPGRPGYQTDTGLFSVRSKFPSQTMSGPGYVVPGVPDVQYFFGGEALHGRYWTLPDELGVTSAEIDENGLLMAQDDPPVAIDGPNRGVAFGVPSSHGCVGLEVTDARWLYSTTAFGTPVDVHY